MLSRVTIYFKRFSLARFGKVKRESRFAFKCQKIYRVTKSNWLIKEVEYIKPKSRMTNVVIPDQITIDGNVY